MEAEQLAQLTARETFLKQLYLNEQITEDSYNKQSLSIAAEYAEKGAFTAASRIVEGCAVSYLSDSLVKQLGEDKSFLDLMVQLSEQFVDEGIADLKKNYLTMVPAAKA